LKDMRSLSFLGFWTDRDTTSEETKNQAIHFFNAINL